MRRFWIPALLALTLAVQGLPVIADETMRTENVAFPAGSTGTSIKGQIAGRDSVVYKLAAEAGQVMDLSLTSANTAVYFNVYQPGAGPGDQALAIGSTPDGNMVTDINRASIVLPVTGTYSVSVYLYRSAARRGEQADYTLNVSIAGDQPETVEGDFADGMQGGPDFWQVDTGSDTLNIRTKASAASTVVVRVADGTVLRNLGCRAAEGRTWCQVATLADPGDEGWAAADFLVEGSDPAAGSPPVEAESTDALVDGTEFNATGEIPCARHVGGHIVSCSFGVVRQGDGNAIVTIKWPRKGARVIFFENGQAIGFDQSQADADLQFSVERDADNSLVTVGDEWFSIPDAVVSGG